MNKELINRIKKSNMIFIKLKPQETVTTASNNK